MMEYLDERFLILHCCLVYPVAEPRVAYLLTAFKRTGVDW